MAELKDSHTTGTLNGWNWAGGADWEMQTFKATSTYLITSIKKRWSRNGTPGTITVSIRATSGGLPTGGDLTSGTTDGDTLPSYATSEDREVSVTPYELTEGVTYAIVQRCVTSGNVLAIRNDSAASYADGQGGSSANSGGSWTPEAGYDEWFEVYGESIVAGGGQGGPAALLIANGQI